MVRARPFRAAARPAALVGDEELVRGALLVGLVQLEDAPDHRPGGGKFGDRVPVVLVRAERAGPGGATPVKVWNVRHLERGERLVPVRAQQRAPAGMARLERVQRVIPGAQEELAGPAPQLPRPRHVAGVEPVRPVGHQIGVGTETPGRRQAQAQVIGRGVSRLS